MSFQAGAYTEHLLPRALEDEKAAAPHLGNIERLLSLLLLLLSLSFFDQDLRTGPAESQRH